MILTCTNHPDLRWSCKDMAYTEGSGYNGSRHLFYFGRAVPGDLHEDRSVPECPCPGSDLIPVGPVPEREYKHGPWAQLIS